MASGTFALMWDYSGGFRGGGGGADPAYAPPKIRKKK